MDEPEQRWQQVAITALASAEDLRYYPTVDDYVAETGNQPRRYPRRHDPAHGVQMAGNCSVRYSGSGTSGTSAVISVPSARRPPITGWALANSGRYSP